MRLSELKTGESATILKVTGHGSFRRASWRWVSSADSGVEVILNAPLKDPHRIQDHGLRHFAAAQRAGMVVVLSDEASEYLAGGARTITTTNITPALRMRRRRTARAAGIPSGRNAWPRRGLRDDRRSHQPSQPHDRRVAGGQPQRQDLAFQRHFGRSRTRRQLQRRDGRRQDRAPATAATVSK